MKKLSFFLLTALITVSISCKKDYPKDIPEWLEKRIKEEKKERRKEDRCDELPLQIQEYKDSTFSTTLYLFTKPCPFCNYTVYDYNGNLLCNDLTIWTDNDSCGTISFVDYEFYRMIWKCQ